MPRLLSAQRLAAIAKRWEGNMTERMTVLPRQQVYDETSGETVATYPEPTTVGLDAYPCRLGEAKAVGEGDDADQERAKIVWRITAPVRSRIATTDRLYVTGIDAGGQSWARTLEVVGSDGPRTWEARRVVYCTELPTSTATVL